MMNRNENRCGNKNKNRNRNKNIALALVAAMLLWLSPSEAVMALGTDASDQAGTQTVQTQAVSQETQNSAETGENGKASEAYSECKDDAAEGVDNDTTGSENGAGAGEAVSGGLKALGDADGCIANEDESGDDADDEQQEDLEIEPYAAVSFLDLYQHDMLTLPEDTAITVSETKYGEAVLFSGKVGDLNAGRVTIAHEFDFDKGAVGRISFDGLKDKDSGMTVKVNIYLDDAEEPSATVELKKQMGKKEWANDGTKSVYVSGDELTGKHTVSLGFEIEGKKDTKNTDIALRSAEFCETTIPVMMFNIDENEGTIDAMNSSEDHSVECYGTVDLKVPDAFNAFQDDEYLGFDKAQDNLEGIKLEYIRGRGNSTWGDENKKPYKVKFDKAQDLFGFGANKHWVLLANRYDNSLIRNRMTYWLGQQLGMEYTPQCVPVEVVMNGEYYGSYLLCEQIRVGTGRVTIDDLDDENIPVADDIINTGGYLLSMDYEQDEDRSFETKHGMQFYIESPDDNVTYFSEWIKAYTQKVEDALYGNNFSLDDGTRYTDLLDLDAAVDYWWVQEFSENGDAYGSGSTYLYKKRDTAAPGGGTAETGKLYWGPLWDFDYVAWGDLEYDSEPSEGLNYTGCAWTNMALNDPVFIEAVKARWSEEGGLKAKIAEITKEGGLLDSYKEQMEPSYRYDHEKYGAFESEITEYSGEIEQLRSWIDQRTANVEEALEELKAEQYTVRFELDGVIVQEQTVYGGVPLESIPEAPEREGFYFAGWYSDIYEYAAAGETAVFSDATFTATYIAEEDIVKPEAIYFQNYNVYREVWDLGSSYSDDTYIPDYRVMPDEAMDFDITWTSSNEDVATIDENGCATILDYGTTIITATLDNGVSNSQTVHFLNGRTSDWYCAEELTFDRTSLTLKEGGYTQLRWTAEPAGCYIDNMLWLSMDEDVASVDEYGIVTANSPGTTQIVLYDGESRLFARCNVTVKPAAYVGTRFKKDGNTYKITKDGPDGTAAFVKAKNKVKVIVPSSVKYDGVTYKVTAVSAKAFSGKNIRTAVIGRNVRKIAANAFKGSRIIRIKLKTKKLTKSRVKGALRGSDVKRVYVRLGKRSLNRKYAKKYSRYFTKDNSGKKVSVKY